MWRLFVYRKRIIAVLVALALVPVLKALGEMRLERTQSTRTVTVSGFPVVVVACRDMTLFGVREHTQEFDPVTGTYRCR